MTIQEMHYNFKLKLNKIASNLNPNLLQAEIDEYLNMSQREYVEQVYKNAETSQQSIDMLSNLLIKTPEHEPAQVPVLVSTGVYKVAFADLDFEYLHLIDVNVSSESCVGKTLHVDVVSHNEIDEKLNSPLYAPSLKWRRVLGAIGRDALGESCLYIYTGGSFTIAEVYINYIKYPNEVAVATYDDITGTPKVVTDSEIARMYHDAIVDIAVQKAYTALLLQSREQE